MTMSEKKEETTGCCARIYQDGRLFSAQILSIIAGSVSLILGIWILMMGLSAFWMDGGSFFIFLIIFSGVAILLSIVALVLSMLTCSCRRSSGFIYTTGVLEVVAFVGVFGMTVLFMIALIAPFGWNLSTILLLFLAVLLPVLWLVAGILTICFVKSGRHAELENELDKEDIEEQNIEDQDIEAAQVPVAVVEPESTTPVENA